MTQHEAQRRLSEIWHVSAYQESEFLERGSQRRQRLFGKHPAAKIVAGEVARVRKAAGEYAPFQRNAGNDADVVRLRKWKKLRFGILMQDVVHHLQGIGLAGLDR